MLSTDNFKWIVRPLLVLLIYNCMLGQQCPKQALLLQAAQAASDQGRDQAPDQARDQAPAQLPASKTISQERLAKYAPISVTVEEDGKQISYRGVPLRVMLAEMVPALKLDTMPEWKALSRQELVMEVTGDDGYPGLVTAIDLAINKAGDRFVLATHRDGKLIASGVHLICKMDEVHTRWVKQVVSLRVVTLAKKLSFNGLVEPQQSKAQ